jgi:hypothetical protein
MEVGGGGWGKEIQIKRVYCKIYKKVKQQIRVEERGRRGLIFLHV